MCYIGKTKNFKSESANYLLAPNLGPSSNWNVGVVRRGVAKVSTWGLRPLHQYRIEYRIRHFKLLTVCLSIGGQSVEPRRTQNLPEVAGGRHFGNLTSV